MELAYRVKGGGLDRDELDQLSSQELHQRAMHVAVRRLDAAFLWSLISALPAAQAAGGHVDEAQTDVTSLSALISDVLHAGGTDAADALRPLYIDYLAKHQH